TTGRCTKYDQLWNYPWCVAILAGVVYKILDNRIMMSKPQDTKKRTFNLADLYHLSCLDHGGRFLTQPHTVRVGIAGAVLTDLARRGHIHVSQELVTIADPTIIDLEPPVHSVLHLIAESPQPQDAEQWINRFSRPA